MKKPTRTDCARWLNEQGESVKSLAKLFEAYKVQCHKGGKAVTTNFGFWLQVSHKPVFDRFYNTWFVKHPEMLEVIYGSVEDTE